MNRTVPSLPRSPTRDLVPVTVVGPIAGGEVAEGEGGILLARSEVLVAGVAGEVGEGFVEALPLVMPFVGGGGFLEA